MVERKKTSKDEPELGLVGRCFHVFREDMKVQYQGVVRGSLGEGLYLIQYYEWLMGEPGTMEIRHVSEMKPGRKPGCWQFYEDNEHMNFWYESRHGGNKSE